MTGEQILDIFKKFDRQESLLASKGHIKQFLQKVVGPQS